MSRFTRSLEAFTRAGHFVAKKKKKSGMGLTKHEG